MKVTTADDGAAALEQITTAPGEFDLVLMDMQMPVMDGLTATQKIRALEGGKAFPIIAMTANAFDEDRQHCIDAGMSDVLTKPIRPELFQQTLLQWLSLRKEGGERGTEAIDEPEEEKASPIPPMDGVGLEEQLQQLPGIDLKQGLGALRGDAKRYLQLLQQFIRLHRDDFQTIRELCRRGDVDRSQRLLHTLKGGGGTLGMVPLVEEIIAAERDLRNDCSWEEIKPGVDRMERLFSALNAGVMALQPPQEERASAMVAPLDGDGQQRIAVLIERLTNGLRRGEAAVVQLLDENRPLLQHHFGKELSRLERQIENYAYDEALQTLDQLQLQSGGEQS